MTEGTPVVMDNGFSGMGIWGFLIIALFLMGGFGGFGANNAAAALGYENLATSSEVQRGFDAQNSMAGQRDILGAVNAGTAQAVAASNQVYHDLSTAISDKYGEIARDISDVRVGQANLLAKENECCMNTLRAIDGANYGRAVDTATINANTVAQTQKILDALATNKIEALQAKVNELQLAQATSGVVRYPLSTTYAVPSPCFGGCGCSV